MIDKVVEQELIAHGYSAGFFFELIVLLLIGRALKGAMAGYKLDDQLTKEDNPAVATSFAGYTAGLMLALSGVFNGPSPEGDVTLLGLTLSPFLYSVVSVALWGVVSIVALNLARVVTDKLLLRGFGNVEELVRDRNLGVGVCEAGGYVGCGLVIRAAVSGSGPWWLTPAWLAIALPLLWGGGWLFKRLVFRSYELDRQIKDDNHAAGVLYGLHLLAVGYLVHEVVLASAVLDVSEATGWGLGKTFGVEIGLSLIYWLVGMGGLIALSLFTDRLMLPAGKLRDEVVEDRNAGVALISGVIAIVGAIMITTIF